MSKYDLCLNMNYGEYDLCLNMNYGEYDLCLNMNDLGSNFRFLYFRGLILKSETKTPLFLSNFRTGSF